MVSFGTSDFQSFVIRSFRFSEFWGSGSGSFNGLESRVWGFRLGVERFQKGAFFRSSQKPVNLGTNIA